MDEEKKDPIKEASKTEGPKQETPKADTPKAETATKPPEEKKAEEKKKEKPVNCAVCKKSIKKKRYYYRNGNFFCTKRCWKTTAKKEELAPAPGNPSDAKDQAPSK